MLGSVEVEVEAQVRESQVAHHQWNLSYKKNTREVGVIVLHHHNLTVEGGEKKDIGEMKTSLIKIKIETDTQGVEKNLDIMTDTIDMTDIKGIEMKVVQEENIARDIKSHVTTNEEVETEVEAHAVLIQILLETKREKKKKK